MMDVSLINKIWSYSKGNYFILTLRITQAYSENGRFGNINDKPFLSDALLETFEQ